MLPNLLSRNDSSESCASEAEDVDTPFDLASNKTSDFGEALDSLRPRNFIPLPFYPTLITRGDLIPRRKPIGVACLICGELCGRVAIGSVDWDGGKIYMRDDDRGVCGGDIMGL